MKRSDKRNAVKSFKKPNTDLFKILSVIFFLFILCLLCYLCFIPVIHNFQEAHIVGKIFMVIGSIVFLVLFTLFIWAWEKVNINNKKSQIFRTCSYLFVFTIYIIALLHYFNYTLWGNANIIWGIMILIFLLSGFYSFVKDSLGKILNLEFKPILLIASALLAFLIALLNYQSSNVETSLLFVKIAIAFCYLDAIAIFVYYILYKKKSKGISISAIISTIFWASLILISFPFYIGWWGMGDKDFSTFVSIYSSVVGGGLTLSGVAWTIQYNVRIRQEDRKNEIKPFFGLLNDLSIEVKVANEHIYQLSTHKNPSEHAVIVGNFVNSDKNCFIIKKMIIRETEYTPDSQCLVSKEEIFQIKIYDVETPNDDSKILLVVEDQNCNEWKYNVSKKSGYIIAINAI